MNAKRRGTSAATKRKTAGASRRGAARRAVRSGWAVVRDARQPERARVAALAGQGRSICEDSAKRQEALKLLRDADAPARVRLAVLKTLQAASFSVGMFAPCRPAYLSALRAVATDPNPELRKRVLGILSRERDSYAQQLLMKGLKTPGKALVPPEKALQLLSYDIHAAAYPVARRIASRPPNPAARHEALRLLAADARSAPVFEKILRDKKEPTEVRQVAASALQSLAPKRLQSRARAIVLDRTESPPLKATSLTALTHFGEREAIAKDAALQKAVDRMQTQAGSAALQRVARSFRGKYRA